MQDIYARAETLLVWLGPRTVDSDEAIDALAAVRRFARRLEPYGEPLDPDSVVTDMTEIPKARCVQDQLDEVVTVMLGQLFGKMGDAPDLKLPQFPTGAVNGLLTRAWWGRVWVLQELAVAQRVVFACGQARIGGGDRRRNREDLETDEIGRGNSVFSCFLEAWDRLTRELGRQPMLMDHRPWVMMETRLRIKGIEETRRRTSDIKNNTNTINNTDLARQPLKWLLQESATASLKATDARDYIYALLGLASDRDDLARLGIRVDYKVSKQDLYEAVAGAYVQQRDLWFLSYCEADLRSISAASLPSWVPDWSSSHGYKPLGAELFFSAARGTAASAHVEARRLALEGLLVDTVSCVAPAPP